MGGETEVRSGRRVVGLAALLGAAALCLLLSLAAFSGRATSAQERKLDTTNADRCDFLDPSVCLHPWPNDYFTRRDPETSTGRRLNLQATSMPANRLGLPINPADYNRNDGFSPGQLIVTKVPGLETGRAFRQTGAVPITDIGAYRDPGQPIVVINARTGRRHPIFAELDANPGDPKDVNLLIRPARNFAEGGRYIVALRRLRDASGHRLRPRPEFRVYRNRIQTSEPAIERRRGHMERIFRQLRRAGIGRRSLYLAWDFTVASERNLSERLLAIRDDAFAELGDTDLSDLEVEGNSPAFVVTAVTDFAPCGDNDCDEGTQHDRLARRVEGYVVVPCYLDLPGCPPGSRFAFSSPTDTIPERILGNTTIAPFICNIPRSAVGDGAKPVRPTLYGHGLLGGADQVNSDKLYDLGNAHGYLFCATDWAGMSEADIPNALTILQDLSRFPTLADRVQQGMLNFLYLGRAMIHPDGFSADPAFRFEDESAIDNRRLFYDGGSQGGIIGGALTAVAPDFTRAALGVPGMNYSTLLRRSVDFDPYGTGEFEDVDTPFGLYDNYPSELERPLILSLIQMLWDRGEANGYAHHITGERLANTPRHKVLLHQAFGDHQVANIATETEARTIGARVRKPILDRGRSPDVRPVWGVKRIRRLPYRGSAVVIWDIGPLRREDGEVKGTTPPPTKNVPNRAGIDPHGPDASETIEGQLQIARFLRIRGRIIDTCGKHACYLDGWTGP